MRKMQVAHWRDRSLLPLVAGSVMSWRPDARLLGLDRDVTADGLGRQAEARGRERRASEACPGTGGMFSLNGRDGSGAGLPGLVLRRLPASPLPAGGQEADLVAVAQQHGQGAAVVPGDGELPVPVVVAGDDSGGARDEAGVRVGGVTRATRSPAW
jgi:hypothetical protein